MTVCNGVICAIKTAQITAINAIETAFIAAVYDIPPLAERRKPPLQ